MAATIAVGAVAGAVVAKATGQNVLRGALMGGLAGWGASTMVGAGADIATGAAQGATGVEGGMASMPAGAEVMAPTYSAPTITSQGATGAASQYSLATGVPQHGLISPQAPLTPPATPTPVISPTPDLGDAALTWIKDNPTAAMMGAQTVGQGLTGMAAGMSAEAQQQAQLQEQLRLEELRRLYSRPGTVPLQPQTGLINQRPTSVIPI